MLPNEGHQWQNLPGCDHWVLAGSPKPKTVGFCNLVGVAIALVSKNCPNIYSVPKGKIIMKLRTFSLKMVATCRLNSANFSKPALKNNIRNLTF